MKYVYVAARILLGVIFLTLGLNGFLWFMPAPPLTGFPAEWQAVVVGSHFIWFTSAAQIVAGVLLLVNRYVIFAIFMLAAILSNILAYHITMMPQTIGLALVTAAIWFVVAWPLRAYFAPLFVAKAPVQSK
jgi:putative oxidoreductase